MYLSAYENSWALVIGINTYRHISPLGFARHDAEVIAKILTDQFGFPKDNVTLLLDQAATREAIMNSFLGSFQIPVDSFNEPLAVIRWRSQP